MPDLEERMRQFTIVIKYAMQTGQMAKRSMLRSQSNLKAVAIKHFGLSHREYDCCYQRAHNFLHSIRDSLTSDDLLAAQLEKAA